MKKSSSLVILLLAFSLVFASGSYSVHASGIYVQGGVSIYIDGQRQAYSYQATVENGRTLVPVRGIFESLGAKVKWNSKNRTVEAYKGDTKIWLKIGSKKAKVNGKEVTLSVPAKVKEGKTLVPLRFISEALGERVYWDGPNRCIYIGEVPTLGKPVSPVPNGAVVVEKEIGSTVYSYKKSLPGGGEVKKVIVSIPTYGDLKRIEATIVGADHQGNFFMGTKYNLEENIPSYTYMGGRPVLESDDFYEVNLIASQFLKAYGVKN